MSSDDTPIPAEEEEGFWIVEDGEARKRPRMETWDEQGVCRLTYNNPFNLELERVWFDGKIVYGAELDERGKLQEEPERVEGQFNIYDSVPGMEKYSPLWQFNYVIVPRDYVPNTLRSEADCLRSGYPIRQSTVVEN